MLPGGRGSGQDDDVAFDEPAVGALHRDT